MCKKKIGGMITYEICLLLLLLNMIGNVYCDPCLSASTLHGEVWRSIAYSIDGASSAICDVTLKEGWYRISSEAGNDTVTESPSPHMCGTVYPVWMNGSIPEVHDGVVERDMCVVSFLEPCATLLTIEVKNCGDYRVYKLVQTQGCPQAYCFGTLLIKFTTTSTTTTTTTTTTALPNVKNINIHFNSNTNSEHKQDVQGTVYIIITMFLALIIVGFLLFMFLKYKCMENNELRPGRPANENPSPPPYFVNGPPVDVNGQPVEKSPPQVHRPNAIVVYSHIEDQAIDSRSSACIHSI